MKDSGEGKDAALGQKDDRCRSRRRLNDSHFSGGAFKDQEEGEECELGIERGR